MDPAALAADALYYSSKKHPVSVAGKWGLSAAVAPAGVTASANDMPPSSEAAILAFTADEVMRLQLPVTPPRVAVAAVHKAWEAAMLAATPASEAGLHVPISTVEHENEQLSWNRPGLPLCRFGPECDGAALQGSPGPLPVYLSIAEQDKYEETKRVPEGALFCLLCIRRDCQALYLAHRAATRGDLAAGHPTFCVPPFQNLVDCPGGYVKSSLSVPVGMVGTVPVSVVGVSPSMQVMTNPFDNTKFVDQGNIVYGARLN